jgi:predicted lipoprotein with Yx(FWY)xxD motif
MTSEPIRDPRKRSRRRLVPAALAGLVLAGALAAVSLAAGSSLTVSSSANASLSETVAVSGSGRTLYTLSPETAHHLLCKTSSCFSAWPPLTVRDKRVTLRDGKGVHGTLALIHRANGSWQVTLRGKPLYRFSGDAAKGEANGQGIKSFGGTWHAASASATAAAPTEPAPAKSETPSYGY